MNKKTELHQCKNQVAGQLTDQVYSLFGYIS